MRKIIGFTLCFAVLMSMISYAGADNSVIMEIKIAAGNDNEERINDGYVSSSSSDIDLGEDNNAAHTPQITALRFPVAMPGNAIVTNAYIQFTARLANSEPAFLTIVGEDSDNALGFVNGITHNISLRAETTASASWDNIPAWNVGERGVNQRTPDLSSIIQEIIDRDGWVSGNTMVLMLSGTGTRNTPKVNAVLHIEYGFSESADSQAPSIPSDITANAVTTSSIQLTWTASTDDVKVSGYKVYRNGIRIATINSTNYADTGLIAGTNYDYQLSAVDAAGNESEKSETLSVSTLEDENPAPTPSDIGLIWQFYGDSETSGRAIEPSVLSQAIAFQTIWKTTYPDNISSRHISGVSGCSLLDSMARYLARRDRANATWIHFQESGNQNLTGEKTPEEFANSFEKFVRSILIQSPSAVISTETAYSFQRESTSYRNWSEHNDALKARVLKLQQEGITVKIAEVDKNIKELVGRIGFATVITGDGGHFRGVGNLLVALSMYNTLGYDVNSLDLSGIPNNQVSSDDKQLCLEIINTSANY